jgi:hypothetical protein
MDASLKAIFAEHRTTDLARAMSLPISTVHTWKTGGIPGAEAPPGKRGPYEMRVQRLKAAAAALSKPKKARAA